MYRCYHCGEEALLVEKDTYRLFCRETHRTLYDQVMLIGMMRATQEQNHGNPFIEIYERENRRKRRGEDRWDFYYVSEDLKYSEADEERVLSGIKLNCKFLKSLYCQVKDGGWAMLSDIAMIKDIAIDEERSKKGYFTQFIRYLLKNAPYKVVYLESVQPVWLKDRLEKAGSLWVKQGGITGNSYILLKSDLGDDETRLKIL